jgi:hydrophobic/amphiphilic exporter-1 (mainly G- bacteria), HAE1 family
MSGGGRLESAVARPVSVAVAVILTILFGGLAVAGIPIQLTPDITRPMMDIITDWPGAAPTEIETDILREQEDVLKGLPGLVEMKSTARPDQGRVTLEFQVGTNLEEAMVRVTNRLAQVPRYPASARQPVVNTADSTGPAIAVVAIRSLSPGAEVAPYRTWVAETIVPEVERIPGVGSVRHIGGRDTEIQIDLDADALAARSIPFPAVAQKVTSELRDRSAGDVTYGKRRFLVRTPIAPETAEEFDRLVLGVSPSGTPIRVSDVGESRLGLRRALGVAFSDAQPSMIFLISREAGSNVLEVTEAIRAKVDELDRTRFAPEGLRLEIISDQVSYINGALELVRNNLVFGAFLAMMALFFFLRSAGASLIISISIPISVFLTMLGMRLMGRSVNVVSLAGMTFAVGMVVDNSIVVLESIDTFRSRAATAAEAALRGAREVWGAVLSSTLTTVAVFVPVIMWEGEVGELLRDVAVAVTFAVGGSFFVSVFVVPSLSARFLKPKQLRENVATRLGARFRDAITHGVARVVRGTLRPLLLVGAVFVLGFGGALWLRPPLEYLPNGNRNPIFGVLVPPPGYATPELEAMGKTMQAKMAEHTGVERDGVPAIERSFFVSDGAFVYAGAVAARDEDITGILPFVRRIQASVPGTFNFTNQASLFGNNLGGTRSVEVRLAGPDLSVLTELGGSFFGAIRRLIPEAQIRPIPSLDPGAPELRLRPKREEMARLGFTADQVALVIDALVDGAILGELSVGGGPQIDVTAILRRKKGAGLSAEDLLTAPIATPSGEITPLGVLVESSEELGPTVIERIERSRTITLMISPPETLPLETAIDVIRDEIVAPRLADGTVPADVKVSISGSAGKLEEAVSQFVWVLALAVIIAYLLMSALFEDFLAPIAVLASLPLAASGGMLALLLVDSTLAPIPLDLMTALGFLILIGVVINNAILIVDGSLTRLASGEALEPAVVEAVRARIRPIFMTTVTSLAGLLPLVVSPGSGSELYRGVGTIVLGGLALSTLLQIFVVPSLFALLWRARRALNV